MTIKKFLTQSISQLHKVGIATARLDAELIMSHVLNKPREWLLAHDDTELTPQEIEQLNNLIARRQRHEPVAYLTGVKEFYGRNFLVAPDVLIPRPESEQIIETLKSLALTEGSRSTALLDVGTGSGCLGVTAKLELPALDVTAVDISSQALTIARQNATNLGASIKFVQSDLLSNLQGQKFDFVIANLPYVDKSWSDLSPELASEPSIALYANDNGLELIKKLITQAPTHLQPSGYLILEADRRQMSAITDFASHYNFEVTKLEPFTITLQYKRTNQALRAEKCT